MTRVHETEDEPVTTTAARAAAQWWAEQLGAPVHKLIADDDRGPDRFAADYVFMAMQLISSDHAIGDGQGERFVNALMPRIGEMLGRATWGVHLGVDYGPDRELADAAGAAGIHLSRFPWKTHMTVRSEYVIAALGYGSPDLLIWSAPDWVRPVCGTHQYDDQWNALDGMCTRPRYHDEEHGDWAPDPARCSKCGGTYVDHYGSRDVRLGHSWEPTGGDS